MTKKQIISLLLFIALFVVGTVEAQKVDSVASVGNATIVKKKTKTHRNDVEKIQKKVNAPNFLLKKFDSRHDFVNYLLIHNTVYEGVKHPEFRLVRWHDRDAEKERWQNVLFYIILGVFLFLAAIHAFFNKYYKDLFHAFVSPTLSRRQLKDQLYQTPFPAFLLNLFFVVSFSVYLYLFLGDKGFFSGFDLPYILSLIVVSIAAIYLIKYIMLRFLGWILGWKEEVDGYIFTIFLINKVMGVFLLPFILLMAFASGKLSATVLDLSLIFVIVLFIYRYFRALPVINSKRHISRFHFFLYLCAFEIAPILIIGKLFVLWVGGA